MPTLLLQAPREEERSLARNLFPVSGFNRHACNHRTAQAKIGQFPRRQGAEFANRPVEDAATVHRHTHVFDKPCQTV